MQPGASKVPPEIMAQMLAQSGPGNTPGGSGPPMGAAGGPPPSAGGPPAPDGPMDPQKAVALLQSLGITPEIAPQVMEALMLVSGGGAGGPPPGGPPPTPPGAGGPPPGMPPQM